MGAWVKGNMSEESWKKAVVGGGGEDQLPGKFQSEEEMVKLRVKGGDKRNKQELGPTQKEASGKRGRACSRKRLGHCRPDFPRDGGRIQEQGYKIGPD